MRRLFLASLLASSTMFGYMPLSALNPFSHIHGKQTSHAKTQETSKHTKHQHHKKGSSSQAITHAVRVS
jgi:hypothetical protein